MTPRPPGHDGNPESARVTGNSRAGTAPPADPDLGPAVQAARHRGDYSRLLLRLADRMAVAGAELLALAAPADCICCAAEDMALCAACGRQVRLLTLHPFRAEGQAPALMDMDGTVILPVIAAGVYRGELAQAVLSFKSHGQGRIGDVLAKGLGRALAAAAAAARDRQDLCLVPVPTGNGAFRRRGFSPVHLLVARLGPDFAGLPVVDALRKSRHAALGPRALPGGQKGLSRGDRAQRVRGSMRARAGLSARDLRGRRCIIVDDVLTTGSTLAEAARALREAGAIVCGAAVLAATRPPLGAVSVPPSGVTVGRHVTGKKNKPEKDE